MIASFQVLKEENQSHNVFSSKSDNVGCFWSFYGIPCERGEVGVGQLAHDGPRCRPHIPFTESVPCEVSWVEGRAGEHQCPLEEQTPGMACSQRVGSTHLHLNEASSVHTGWSREGSSIKTSLPVSTSVSNCVFYTREHL